MSDLKKIKKMVRVKFTQRYRLGEQIVDFTEDALGSWYRVDKDTSILAFDTVWGDKKLTHTMKMDNRRGTHPQLSWVTIGDVHSRQTFCFWEHYSSQFFYGGRSLVMRNYTDHINIIMGDDYGDITVGAEITNGGEYLGRMSLHIEVK